MAKPPFQFGLKAVFVAMTTAATFVAVCPRPLAIVFIIFTAMAAFQVTASIALCVFSDWLYSIVDRLKRPEHRR
jgi:hypothetical protein